MLEIILMLACLFLLWFYKIVDVKGPPIYKRCWPFIGHAIIILKCTTHELLNDAIETVTKDCEDLGGIMRCYIGPTTFYWITNPEDVLNIGRSSINKHYYYKFAKSWFGNSMFTSSGSTWKRHKGLLSPAFSSKVLSEYVTEINSETRKYLPNWDSKVGKGPFDPAADIRLITLKTVFSSLLNTSIEKDENFYNVYMENFDKIMETITSRFQTIIYHSDFLYKFSKLRKTEQLVAKTATKTVEEIIDSKRKSKKFDIHSKELTLENHTKTFLNLLLELQDEGKLTKEEVQDEINTVMVAALDTSSRVLNITLVLIGSHPDVQDKIVKELTEVLGNEDRDIDKHDLPKLVYHEAVIMEALRLYPPIPLSIKTLEKPVQLKNYTLPEGSNCVLSLHGVNRSSVWGEDRETFRPERWFERNDLRNYFAGFSVGRRSCVGKSYAILSLKTMLAHIMRRYRVAADASKLRFKYEFVTNPVAGHHISIERR